MEISRSSKLFYKVFENIDELVTGIWPTPLYRLKSLSNEKYDVWAKLEFFNALSHSIKDRAVWNMFRKVRDRGELKDIIYEASSGNVGISLAALSAAHRKKFKVFLPKPTLDTTITLLKVLGAEVIKTNYMTIDMNFVEEVKKKARDDGATNLNQFQNDDNFEIHYLTTAREIDVQLSLLSKKPKAIIAGIGTSGHISAITKYFKEKYKDVQIVGVQPAKGSTIPGIKRLETKPKWIQFIKVDHVVEVKREDAIKEVIWLARNEGLLVGLSSGAVIRGFKEVKNLTGAGTYVLVFPDDSFKYVNVLKNYV